MFDTKFSASKIPPSCAHDPDDQPLYIVICSHASPQDIFSSFITRVSWLAYSNRHTNWTLVQSGICLRYFIGIPCVIRLTYTNSSFQRQCNSQLTLFSINKYTYKIELYIFILITHYIAYTYN